MDKENNKIEVSDLHKAFGRKRVLNGVDLKIKKGESLVVIGGSGTGKSVLIKCIQGLIRPDSGSIKIDGFETVGAARKENEKHYAKMGMLFQGGALFDSLSVWENVAFGLLENQKMPRRQAREKAVEVLRQVGLGPDVADLSPSELSGGMRQRAGIARTLAMNPKVILMDEPFSAVDHLTKCTLQEELINIRQAENKTVLFVTHDINEAVFLADRVVLLSPRPSTIQKIYEIPLEQKRGRSDPLLLKIAAEIAKDINSGGQDIPNNYWGNL